MIGGILYLAVIAIATVVAVSATNCESPWDCEDEPTNTACVEGICAPAIEDCSEYDPFGEDGDNDPCEANSNGYTVCDSTGTCSEETEEDWDMYDEDQSWGDEDVGYEDPCDAPDPESIAHVFVNERGEKQTCQKWILWDEGTRHVKPATTVEPSKYPYDSDEIKPECRALCELGYESSVRPVCYQGELTPATYTCDELNWGDSVSRASADLRSCEESTISKMVAMVQRYPDGVLKWTSRAGANQQAKSDTSYEAYQQTKNKHLNVIQTADAHGPICSISLGDISTELAAIEASARQVSFTLQGDDFESDVEPPKSGSFSRWGMEKFGEGKGDLVKRFILLKKFDERNSIATGDLLDVIKENCDDDANVQQMTRLATNLRKVGKIIDNFMEKKFAHHGIQWRIKIVSVVNHFRQQAASGVWHDHEPWTEAYVIASTSTPTSFYHGKLVGHAGKGTSRGTLNEKEDKYANWERDDHTARLKMQRDFLRQTPGVHTAADNELKMMWTPTLHRSSPSAELEGQRLFIRYVVQMRMDPRRQQSKLRRQKSFQTALKPGDVKHG